eukprot:gene8353-14322_t
MANAGRRKQKNAFVEVKGELSKIRLEMNSMGEKLSSVEKDKENLRCINHALIEKIKKETEKDYPFKLFLLTRELENEREKSMLAMQKLCAKQIFAVFLQENFGTLADKDGCQTSLTMQNMMNILKELLKIRKNIREHNTSEVSSFNYIDLADENVDAGSAESSNNTVAENSNSENVFNKLKDFRAKNKKELILSYLNINLLPEPNY